MSAEPTIWKATLLECCTKLSDLGRAGDEVFVSMHWDPSGAHVYLMDDSTSFAGERPPDLVLVRTSWESAWPAIRESLQKISAPDCALKVMVDRFSEEALYEAVKSAKELKTLRRFYFYAPEGDQLDSNAMFPQESMAELIQLRSLGVHMPDTFWTSQNLRKLAHALHHLPSLEMLSLSWLALHDDVADILVVDIRSSTPSLSTLWLYVTEPPEFEASIKLSCWFRSLPNLRLAVWDEFASPAQCEAHFRLLLFTCSHVHAVRQLPFARLSGLLPAFGQPRLMHLELEAIQLPLHDPIMRLLGDNYSLTHVGFNALSEPQQPLFDFLTNEAHFCAERNKLVLDQWKALVSVCHIKDANSMARGFEGGAFREYVLRMFLPPSCPLRPRWHCAEVPPAATDEEQQLARAIQQSKMDSAVAKNRPVPSSLASRARANSCPAPASRAGDAASDKRSHTSSSHLQSSEPTVSSQSIRIHPRAVSLTKVRWPLPSLGTVDHGATRCMICKAHLRGDCERGARCHKCHHEEHAQEEPVRRGGRSRTRAIQHRHRFGRTPSPEFQYEP